MIRAIVAILAVGILAGCGSGGNDGGVFSARVVDLALEDSLLRVGEATVLSVDFDYDIDAVFEDDENVAVVIRLPAGVTFREGTAEIQNSSGDKQVGAQITVCAATGETYLVFDLDRFDLEDSDSFLGDARLNLTVEGDAPVFADSVDARADGSPQFSCDVDFFPEASVAIAVS